MNLQKMNKRNKGITLIALAVTIIVMLILAGVTISTLTGNSTITRRATEAKEKNAIARVEEEAQIEYSDLLMNNQIDSIGENITIEHVKDRMEKKGYEIKAIGENNIGVAGIELSENKISLKAGESKEVIIKYKYPEGTILKYYVKINDYYHEMKLENGKIEITDEKVKEPVGSESNKTLQIAVIPTTNGINAVQEGGKIKITADASIEAGTKITIKATYGSLVSSTCEVAITREIHWVDIADQSYVGYYADLDGDGEPEGIIFADLLKGNTEGKSPVLDSYGAYTIPVITMAKEYKISQENYTDKLGGTTKMLTSLGDGTERFYVMSFKDIATNKCTWYKNAHGKMNASDTSPYFGKGKSNTATMIAKWNANKDSDTNGYGLQSTSDLWGQIQTEVNNGWFVPSKEEWNAFGGEIGINFSNYSKKGLNSTYWTSSQFGTSKAFRVLIASNGWMYYSDCNVNFYVRLATTF